jgi:phosphoadenosine phosphosulfate reductase
LANINTLKDKIAGITFACASLDLAQRIATVRQMIVGRIVFTTSFGIEDQAISDAVFGQAFDIDVVTFDTGRLFPETYAVWTETERRYGCRIRALYPDTRSLESLVARQGISGFRTSVEERQACCAIRKVEPLGRALAGAAAWITGIRSEQSGDRARMSCVAVDPQRGLIKINPLFDWTREQVAAYLRQRGIPYNPLHDRGFLSIGCEPCTRAVEPGEDDRVGRWWWEGEGKKECGLHVCSRQARANNCGHSQT